MKLNELDKSKTYCIGINPGPNVAPQIRQYQECAIPCQDRWTQVGIAFHEVCTWNLIYCDIGSEGVTTEWLHSTLRECEEANADVFCFPYEFDIPKALSMIGTPFSRKKLQAFKTGEWESAKDDPGVTCAEMLSRCVDDGPWYHDFPEWRPVDWQMIGKSYIERLEP